MDIKQRFIEVLKQDILHWEEAASSCESLIGAVVGEQQKGVMAGRAKMYRERAKQYKDLLEQLKRSD